MFALFRRSRRFVADIPYSSGLDAAIIAAEKSAADLGHDYLGPEHLLLGLISDSRSSAARVLRDLDVDVESVRSQILVGLRRGRARDVQDFPFTAWSVQAIKQSAAAALEAREEHLRTAHLLLGLLVVDQGGAAEVLGRAGVTKAKVASAVARLRDGLM